MSKRVGRFFICISLMFISLLILNIYKTKIVYTGTDDISSYEDIQKLGDGGLEIVDAKYFTFEKKYDFEKQKEKLNKEVELKYYKVKKGDSLYKISRKTGQDMDILVANNPGVKNGVIKVGQKLNILSENGIYYRVKSGDALIKIANKYNVSLAALLKDNNLNDTQLKVGQKLYVANPNLSFLKKSNRGYAKTKNNGMKLAWPIKWKGVTSRFGTRFHPVLKRNIFHAGVDLRGGVGVPIYSPADGKIVYSGWMSGYGRLIKLKHSNGYSTRYAHLSKTYVRNGQYVKKGKLIGRVGKSGRVTGPHLHYEIRKNGKPLNPIKFRRK